jgi:hypothetical protein
MEYDSFESDDSESSEESVLLSNILSAQEDGQTVYLTFPGGAVKIEPGDNPHDALKEALAIVKDIHLIQTSYEPTQEGVLMHGNKIDSRNYEKELEELFKIHAPESFNSLQEFTDALIEKFDEPIWFMYKTFLEKLPRNLDREKIDTLVVPLLEAGEMPHIKTDVEYYLHEAGYSTEEIGQLKLKYKNEYERREAFGNFVNSTGVSPAPSSIQNLEQLDKVIGQSVGAQWVTYCNYLKSLPLNTPQEIIDDIVIPLSQREESWVPDEAQKTLKRLRPDQ